MTGIRDLERSVDELEEKEGWSKAAAWRAWITGESASGDELPDGLKDARTEGWAEFARVISVDQEEDSHGR